MEKTERKSLHFVKEKITGTPFVPLGRIWMDYSYLKRKAAFNLKKKKKRRRRKEKEKLLALTQCIDMLLNLRNFEG